MTISLIVDKILSILNYVVIFVVSLGLLVFLYGLFTYLTNYSDEKKRTESLQYIFYGILGLFIMVSVWGLVGLITGTFGLEKIIPQLQFWLK